MLVAAMAMATSAAIAGPNAERVAERHAMVREVATYSPGEPLAASVLDAMRRVPRHLFVPGYQQPHADENRPLAIGHGQTISQPYIVALMTDLVRPKKTDRVLEIGTGSGYQAAVLAGLVRQVYSIEVIPELAAQAGKTLHRLGYGNVAVKAGDGNAGWPDHAPYDGIIVTAAAARIPQALLAQLRKGGRMVVPVGESGGQELVLVEKSADGAISERSILPVAFVPLIGSRAR